MAQGQAGEAAGPVHCDRKLRRSSTSRERWPDSSRSIRTGKSASRSAAGASVSWVWPTARSTWRSSRTTWPRSAPSSPAARGESASLRIEPLAEHPLCLVAGKDTPFGRELSEVLEGQTVPLSKLSAFPLVGLDPQSGIRRQLEAQLRGKSRGLCFRFEAGGWEAAKEYARHGLGVAVLPVPLLAREDRKDFIIRRLPPEIRIQDLLIDRDAEQGPAHEAMKVAMKEVKNPRLRGV